MMSSLEVTTEIGAPPERVAAFFVPQRMPYWYGAEMGAEFEVERGADEFQVGLKIRVSGRILRRAVGLTMLVTRYKPGRVLEWKFRDEYGVRGTQCWTIEPSGAGTRVALREEYELPGGKVAKVADALFMKGNVARRDRLHLSKLKSLAERRS